jgi:asparagine synthase (glutamine-hydrolysing)
MCGIAGIVDLKGRREIDRRSLSRMNEAQAYRGPDGEGSFFAPGVALGHRRLSIIDVAGGQQPLFNEDGSIVVVYNGEIYNYREVLTELVAAGHVFRTRCDTEVIVHAWEEWGEACLDRFRGMFAFALWDARRGELFMARDRLGEKPLYYTVTDDGFFVFASELTALRSHPSVGREIEPCAVEEFFAYGYVPDPRTIYRNVFKLPPAHKLRLRRDEAPPAPRPYWDVAFDDSGPRDEAEVCEELIVRLRRAVGERLMSEVPLGAFLSGGVDSSAVVAMMAGLGPEPAETCSISFAQPEYDESRYAAAVARRHGAHHRDRRVDGEDCSIVGRLADVYGEPFGDSSAIPTFRVCQLAREKVTVALSGDGGDELFAGYRRYRWYDHEERVRSAIPDVIRRPLFGLLGSVYPKADWAPRVLRAKATLEGIARDPVEGYFHGVSVATDRVRQRLFSRRLKAELQGYNAVEVLRRHMDAARADDHVSRAQYADLKTYLPGDILTKVDRASMANSLEVRVPLLDHTFVEWAASLPRHLLLRRGEGKSVFKRALEPYLPRETLYRPKMGFAVPLARWFRGPLRARMHEVLAGGELAKTGLFDLAAVGSFVEQHESGLRDHSATLWLLLMFDSFLRSQETGRSESAAAGVAA